MRAATTMAEMQVQAYGRRGEIRCGRNDVDYSGLMYLGFVLPFFAAGCQQTPEHAVEPSTGIFFMPY
jgi:hypothetical protein